MKKENEITFIISDFLERVFSLTKDELMSSSSRLIWMDHIERLKKKEGVYWFVSLNKEFVFKLASKGGILYLIRNYKSTDNNIVSIDLSNIPDVPCIVQVAWDVNFIELTISLNKGILPEKKIGYKARIKTESWNPPIELLEWIEQQSNIQQKTYLNEVDFRRKLLEIIKGIQKKINIFSTLEDYWVLSEKSESKNKYMPKLGRQILPIIIEYISEELKLAAIDYSYKVNTKSDNIFITFSTQVEKIGISNIELEIQSAHSEDLLNEISINFPNYLKSKNSNFGIFLVLWFKGDWFSQPSYDSYSSFAINMQKSLYQANHDKSIYNNNITISVLDLSQSDIKRSRNLKIANCSSLKFEQKDKELIANYKNKKILFGGFLGLIKRNKVLSDEEKIEIAKGNLQLFCKKRKLLVPKINNLNPVYTKDIINNYTPFYKYVEPDIFEKNRSGYWQLGTIEQYRTIENKKQRDEFEGYSFLCLDINNRIVNTSFISGFNYLILCGTMSPDSDYHKNNFGNKIMYFPDVRLLAEKICTLINAKKYYIQKIEYNSLKFYVSQHKIVNKYFQLENLLSPPFFDIICEHILYPSIFVKPENYEPENEVRLVFEMERDQHEPFRFFSEELNRYVEFL